VAASIATPDGSWLVADGTSGRVRLFNPITDTIDTVAGYREEARASVPIQADSARYHAALGLASGISVIPTSPGVALVSDRLGSQLQRLTLVDPADPLSWTMAATGPSLAGAAGLLFVGTSPASAEGTLYVAEAAAHVVSGWSVSVGASLGTSPVWVAGQRGQRGAPVAGDTADTVLFDEPVALARGLDGGLYIAEASGNRVRRVGSPPAAVDPTNARRDCAVESLLALALDTASPVETVLGDGTPASSGEGTPASTFPVDAPQGLLVDRYGNLFVTSRTTVRVVIAGPDCVATGDDEVRTIYGTAPRSGYPAALTQCLTGLLLDVEDSTDGAIFVLDACQGMVVRLTRTMVASP
jgi:hypothetical protein